MTTPASLAVSRVCVDHLQRPLSGVNCKNTPPRSHDQVSTPKSADLVKLLQLHVAGGAIGEEPRDRGDHGEPNHGVRMELGGEMRLPGVGESCPLSFTRFGVTHWFHLSLGLRFSILAAPCL